MVVKKRRSAKATKAEKHVVQNNLCSNIKAIYFSKDEASIKRVVQRMTELFTEASSSSVSVEHYLEELQFRMNYLIDNKTDLHARIRCLGAIVLCAINLMKNGELTVLDFLVEYCEKLSNAESQVIRQYICLIIGIIYKGANLSNGEYGTASILPDTHYRKLFAILRERWIDVREAVRREAICALSYIQQDAVNADHDDAVERSPRDMIMASLGDCASECREEAVKRLIINDISEVRLILNITLRDSDLCIKRAALLAILANHKFEEMSSRARMEILEHLMAPAQQSLKGVIVKLLVHWIKLMAKAEADVEADTQCEKSAEDFVLIGTLHFLRNLDVIRKERICEMALALALRHFATERKGLVNVITALTENSEECLKRSNYKALILESGSTLSEKALLLFHWRVLIELSCVEYDKREDQKSICLFKLVPTLHVFTEFVTEFVDFYAESQESPFRDNLRGGRRKLEDTRQFCLIQLLRILQCLDEEPVGMNSWKKLLFFILTNTDIRLSQPLAQIVIESLMQFHFPGEDDVEPALHEFCDAINTFMQVDQQVFNASALSVGGHFSPSRGFIVDGTQANTAIKTQMDEPTRNRSLLILNSMLRSGHFKSISAELQGLYDSILPDSFGSPISDIRILALECLGVFSLLDEDYAKQHICLVGQSLLVDLKAVKLTCITVLTDIVLRYGYKNVSRWYLRSDDDENVDGQSENLPSHDSNNVMSPRRRSLEGENLPEKSYDIIDKMMELSTNKCPDLSFSATECLCKWCLSATSCEVFEWRRVVQHVLLLLFRDECKENPKQMACLSRFMPLFVGTSRRNQILLAEVFLSAMKTLRDGDLDNELICVSDVSEEALAAYVIKMTSFYVLQENAFEREKGTAHSYLAEMMLTGLKANDYFSPLYCKMFGELEINDALLEDEINQLIFLCTDVYNETFVDAKNMKHLQQFLRRLSTLRDKIKAIAPAPRSVDNLADNACEVFGAEALLNPGICHSATKRGVTTPLKVVSSSSTLITPQKRILKGAITPRTSNKTATSIATLTSELSIGRKRTRRPIKGTVLVNDDTDKTNAKSRSTPRIARRPVMERAAKKAAVYRADETIVEEDEEQDENIAENYEIQEDSE